MSKVHYVYKITDPITGQFYFGSRSHGDPETDDYMGSMKSWTPVDEGRLVKEIIRDDFETREDAIDFEDEIIGKYIDDELNENYYRPHNGFHTIGRKFKHSEKTKQKISEALTGRKMSSDHKNKIRKSRENKTWEDIHGSESAKKMKEIRSDKYSGSGNPMYGIPVSESRIEKQRRTLNEYYKKNKSPMLGKKHSMDSRMKMSESKSKQVIHIESGKIFNSQLEAAKYFSIDNTTVSYHCLGKSKIKKFKFIEHG